MESQAAKGGWDSKRQDYGGYSQDDWKAWKNGWPNRRIADRTDSDDHQDRRKSKPPRGGFHQGYRRITTRDGVTQD